MLPALSVLIELQALDSAIDAARKRLADFPAAEKLSTQQAVTATAALDAARTALNDATSARKLAEKDVAGVDLRLARFEEHKAAVKTNQEFHALQHEMEMGKEEKSVLEERVLVLMLEADALTASVKAAETALAAAKKALEDVTTGQAKERTVLDADITRLLAERTAKVPDVDAPTLAKYEQLLKGRRGVAVAQMVAGTCTACHVRLRPAVEVQLRRNDALYQCDSCQRLLYFVPPPPAEPAPEAAQ